MQKSCVQFNTYGEITVLFIVLFLSITPIQPRQAHTPKDSEHTIHNCHLAVSEFHMCIVHFFC